MGGQSWMGRTSLDLSPHDFAHSPCVNVGHALSWIACTMHPGDLLRLPPGYQPAKPLEESRAESQRDFFVVNRIPTCMSRWGARFDFDSLAGALRNGRPPKASQGPVRLVASRAFFVDAHANEESVRRVGRGTSRKG